MSSGPAPADLRRSIPEAYWDIRDLSGEWPLWQVPARYVALVQAGVRDFLAADLRLSRWLRLPDVVPLAAVLVLVIIPSLVHAFLPPTSYGVDLLRLGWVWVYTESLVFMALALGLSLLAPTLGVLLVLAFVAVDLPASLVAGQIVDGWSVAGRFVSYWLLWLLVVEVPVVARWSARSIGIGVRLPGGPVRQAIELATAAISAGVLVWIWTQAVTLLIRPVFIWGGYGSLLQIGSQPTYEAIAPVQEAGLGLAVAAAVIAAVVGLVAMLIDGTAGLPLFAEDGGRGGTSGRAIVGHVIAAALLVAALGGVVSGAIDVAILFVALLAGRPAALWVRRRAPVTRLLDALPWIVRFVAGFVLAYAVALVVVVPLYNVFVGSEFLPLVVAIALGGMIFEFLLLEEASTEEAPAARGLGAGPAVGLFVLVALGWLALPLVASADNCGGRYDCYPSPFPAAAGAAAAAAAAAASRRRPPPKPPDKKPLDQARQATDALGHPAMGLLTGFETFGPGLMVSALLDKLYDGAGKISQALGGDPPRDDFQVIEAAAPQPTAELPSWPGIPAQEHAALAQLAQAMREVVAHGEAAIVSYDRYGGARRARDRYWAARQAAAVVRHKKEMGGGLKRAADAIDAFLATGSPGLQLTPEHVRAYQERLRNLSLSAQDTATARSAGLSEAELAGYVQTLLAVDPEQAAGDRRSRLVELGAAYRALADAFDALPMPPQPQTPPQTQAPPEPHTPPSQPAPGA